MLTKTQLAIMMIFVSKITEKFSIKQIAEKTGKPYPLIHRSIKTLIENKLLERDAHNLLSLNYKENHYILSYIEGLKMRCFLDGNKTISLFVKDALEGIKLDYFTMLLFGSYAKGHGEKGSDVDILVILEDENKIEAVEKFMDMISSKFSLKFDCNVISAESVFEMLAKRDQANVMNESLDNHVLLFGAENYYRLLKNARC